MSIETVNQERHVPSLLPVVGFSTVRVPGTGDSFGIIFELPDCNGKPVEMPRSAIMALRKMIDQTLLDFPSTDEPKGASDGNSTPSRP